MQLSYDNQKLNKEKLKSFLFDLLIDETTGNYKSFLNNLLNGIKDTVTAKAVHLYLENKYNHYFTMEYSTETISKGDNHYWLSKDRWEHFDELARLSEKVVFKADILWDDLAHPTFISVLQEKDNQKVVGWYMFEFLEEPNKEQMQLLYFFAKDGAKIIKLLENYFSSLAEDARYEQLYRVTAKFHSSMDMDDVLGEIIKTLREVYSTFEYYLLLSHDNRGYQHLPIKDLQYGSEHANKAATQAYLTGEVQFEDSIEDERSILYAPLKGKQGVYGVLQVMAPNALVFPKEEVGFIELLANTAGSALENAQLYQQSKRLISDLQLINKTSHRLNSNLRLSETIKFMSEQITKSFQAEEVGFIIFLSEERYEVLQGSTGYFTNQRSEGLLSSLNEKIRQEEDALFIGDMTSDPTIIQNHYRSLMAVPMMQSGTLKGAVYVLHQIPYLFTFENFKLLQSLIHHSTLAFTNSMLREELEKLVITDHLTKLYSRNYLDDKIHYSMETDENGTFILVDIDNFKCVNDTYGHQVGDEIIVQVSNIIKDNIRDFDIGARWGGEELAVYLPRVKLDIGIMVAERLVKKVEELTNPQITISAGIAYWDHEKHDTVKKLFNRADEALYEAKREGKNRVVVYKAEDE